MKKKEILARLGGHNAKIIVKDPAEIEKEQKRINKLNSMKIAMTYIEIKGMADMTPEKATEIADKFLKWLEK